MLLLPLTIQKFIQQERAIRRPRYKNAATVPDLKLQLGMIVN
jgi:hypothetical protein